MTRAQSIEKMFSEGLNARTVIRRAFPDAYVGTESEVVQNPFSGESVTLCAEAVAMHDLIKGAEMMNDWKTFDDARDIFMHYWAHEYMVLLD